jgi:hypothetical protein
MASWSASDDSHAPVRLHVARTPFRLNRQC